jgi:LysM repeat protein
MTPSYDPSPLSLRSPRLRPKKLQEGPKENVGFDRILCYTIIRWFCPVQGVRREPMDDYEEDLEEEGSEPKTRGSRSMGEGPSWNRPIQILLGVLIIVIVAGGVYYFVKVRPAAMEENAIQTKLAAFEQKIASLEKQIADNQGKLDKAAADPSLLERVDVISQRVDALEKRGQGKAQIKEKSSKPSSTEDTQPQYHKVQKGETLYAISKKYGISAAEIRKLNHLSKDQSVHTGQKLMLVPLDKGGNPGGKN